MDDGRVRIARPRRRNTVLRIIGPATHYPRLIIRVRSQERFTRELVGRCLVFDGCPDAVAVPSARDHARDHQESAQEPPGERDQCHAEACTINQARNTGDPQAISVAAFVILLILSLRGVGNI